ncbi:hypothetical protein BASA83_005363 [Batrachochytrium salamandrivorans]|nr:hypothetical protein BASA83_005363 [Batrachochytrium salamandrivorans]
MSYLVYVNWKDGKKIVVSSKLANAKCPQKIIKFYERHLKFVMALLVFLPNCVLHEKSGIGSLLTRSLVSRVRLLERSVTKKTPINAICSGTDNDVFTLNVPRAVGKIPALVLVSVGPNSYTGTDTG